MKYADEIQKANGLISQAIHMLEEVTCAMMDDGFVDEQKLNTIEHHIGELEHVEGELESLAPTN
jgi:hypothetical protein|tara:strand:+ start:89 stop:280 length:192 start_codon:yes stop_codon:yes gene_type:complete